MEFGLEAELVAGSGGIFEVECGGETAWTNRDRRGLKPSAQEVLDALRPFHAQA